MISIERSVTNKKRALKIRDKFVMDWINAKSMAQSEHTKNPFENFGFLSTCENSVYVSCHFVLYSHPFIQ